MLTLGLGDLATRIVRAFSVRGRIPTTMDEVIVPTALVMDLTDPLFAANPGTFIFEAFLVGAAATFPFASLTNQTISTVTIIDKVIVQDVSTSVPVTPVNFWLNRNVGLPAGVGAQAQTALLNVDSDGTPLPARIATTAEQGTPAANGFLTNFQWDQAPPVQNGRFETHPGIILFPGDTVAVQFGPEAATVTKGVFFYGREFRRG